MQGRSLLPVLRGQRARGLAHVDVLPLLPRPRRPQHARALRRPHRAPTSSIYFWKKDQWELFDLVHDPAELHNLYGQPGQEALTRDAEGGAGPAEAAVRDDDQFADEQPPNGVDGTVAKLRGK